MRSQRDHIRKRTTVGGGVGAGAGETHETRAFIEPGWVYQSPRGGGGTLKLQTPGPLGKLILIKSACFLKDIIFMESQWIYHPCFLPVIHSAWGSQTKDTQKWVQKVKRSSLYGT